MSKDAGIIDLVGELERRSRTYTIANEECFDKQLAVITDPSRLKAVFCPRRAGKSNAIGIYLLQEALAFPRRTSLYVGLTSETAADNVYQEVIEPQCKKRKINIKYNATTHTIRFPNGHKIKLAGMESSPRDMEKLLGKKYHLAVIDECQSFTQDLRRLVTKKLWPAMADYRLSGGGRIVLAGTPGELRGKHFWYAITKQTSTGLPDPDREPGWVVHEWTVPDNPHMREQFADVCKDALALYGPGYIDRPEFKSEWFGKWIIDKGSTVYKWDPKVNVAEDEKTIRSLLEGSDKWTYIASCDLGWEDATAVVISAYCSTDPNWYVVHSEKVKHMLASQLGATLKAFQKRFNIKRMIVDTGGGASKLFAMSLASEYELPIFAAQKTEKENHVGRMNSDFISGRIKVIRTGGANHELIEEWERLVLDRKKMDEEGKWKVDEKFDDHISDAALYGWRDSLHQHSIVPDLEPGPTLASRMLADIKRQRPMWEEIDEDPWQRHEEEMEAREIVRRLT